MTRAGSRWHAGSRAHPGPTTWRSRRRASRPPAVGFDHANRKAVVYGKGDNPISWISFLDVAQFAVATLDNPTSRNATLQLDGPEGIAPSAVVKIFEKAGGRAFEVTHVPVEALQAKVAAATDPMEKSFATLMLSYASATPIAFPVKLKTVAEHARSSMT